MFNIGPMEWLVILVVIVIFIKPEDLPKLVRQIGKAYGSFSRMMNEINATIADLDQDIRKPLIKTDPFTISRTTISSEISKAESSEPLNGQTNYGKTSDIPVPD